LVNLLEHLESAKHQVFGTGKRDFVVSNTMVQLDFGLDSSFEKYDCVTF